MRTALDYGSVALCCQESSVCPSFLLWFRAHGQKVNSVANSDDVQVLKDQCTKIVAYFAEEHASMIERPEWGHPGFEAGRTAMGILSGIATLALKLPVEIAPAHSVGNALTSLSRVELVLRQIDQFNADHKTGADRQALIIDLNNSLESTIEAIGPWLTAVDALTGDYRGWKDEAHAALADLQRKVKEFDGYASDQRTAIATARKAAQSASEEARDAAQAAYAAAGAEAFTRDFLQEAENRHSQAKRWLWGSGGFAFLALLMAAWIIFGWGLDGWEQGWQGVAHLVGRVMGFSILLYATVWCSRIALANLHQEAVNKHRANSIMTLQAFRNAVSDPDIKDAVVLEAARATFENVPPGFVTKGTEQGVGSVRLLDSLVGRATPKG